MNSTYTPFTTRMCTNKGAVPRPTRPRLNSGEIHIWKASLDGAAHEASSELLSADERARAGRYRFARDRMRFVAGRAVLRMILAGYLDREPAELTFIPGPQGKPRLVMNGHEDPLHFNVTHADSIALYAVARDGEVGIDIERVREIPDWAGIADHLFAPREQARLRRMTADRRQLAFLQAWTRREALLKASGEGLTGEHGGRLSPRESGFSVHSLTAAPGYLAALACGFSMQRMVFMTWSESSGSARSEMVETHTILL